MLNFAVLILALACTTIWVRPFERRSDEFAGKPFDDDPDNDKYPKFKPFVCNDKQMQEWLNATQLKYFTLNEGNRPNESLEPLKSLWLQWILWSRS